MLVPNYFPFCSREGGAARLLAFRGLGSVHTPLVNSSANSGGTEAAAATGDSGTGIGSADQLNAAPVRKVRRGCVR